MLHRIGSLALAGTLLAACTTIHRVPRPTTVEELQAMTERDLAAGTFATRRGLATVSVLFQPTDGSSGLVPVARDRALAMMDSGGGAYDSSLLRGYEVKRTGTGALEGLAIGVVTGALAGGAIGAGLGDWSDCRGECDFIPGETAMLWSALILGAATGVVGALIGAGVRHTDRYLF
jgi:hypothetical protein